jgi:hypothetical protein
VRHTRLANAVTKATPRAREKQSAPMADCLLKPRRTQRNTVLFFLFLKKTYVQGALRSAGVTLGNGLVDDGDCREDCREDAFTHVCAAVAISHKRHSTARRIATATANNGNLSSEETEGPVQHTLVHVNVRLLRKCPTNVAELWHGGGVRLQIVRHGGDLFICEGQQGLAQEKIKNIQ